MVERHGLLAFTLPVMVESKQYEMYTLPFMVERKQHEIYTHPFVVERHNTDTLPFMIEETDQVVYSNMRVDNMYKHTSEVSSLYWNTQSSWSETFNLKNAAFSTLVWLCCSSRTLSTWTNNFTTRAVKLFAFVWKQRWSVSIIYAYVCQLFGTIAYTCGYCSKQMQTISPHMGWNCLYVLMSPIYLVFSSWYLFNTRRKLQQHDRLCSILPP